MKSIYHPGHNLPPDAVEIINDSSPDGDDTLFQTRDGEFFLITTATLLDGKRLEPGQSLEDVAPEIAVGTASNLTLAQQQRLRRVKREKTRVDLTREQALVWCIKTQIPDCFRGYLLDCL